MTREWTEAKEIEWIFGNMLAQVTGDGQTKRQAGTKVLWKVDPEHEKGLFSHIAKWKAGRLSDEDSGAHPLVHAAWRCLAIAWQETNGD